MAYALKKVNSISCETGNILDDDHFKQSDFCIFHKLKKLMAVLDLCTGDALIGIKPDKVMTVFFGKFREEFFLRFKAVELVFLVR